MQFVFLIASSTSGYYFIPMANALMSGLMPVFVTSWLIEMSEQPEMLSLAAPTSFQDPWKSWFLRNSPYSIVSLRMNLGNF
jgi:hypothetical protein